MQQILFSLLLHLAQSQSQNKYPDRRRLPRLLKGGGGGGGSSAVSVDPNNFVIPEGHIFHSAEEWPPHGSDSSALTELLHVVIFSSLFVLCFFGITHLYGVY